MFAKVQRYTGWGGKQRMLLTVPAFAVAFFLMVLTASCGSTGQKSSNDSSSSATTASQSNVPDAPLAILNVVTGSIRSDSAAVNWTTNVRATSQLDYGL